MDSRQFESMVQAMVRWGAEAGARKKGAVPCEPDPKIQDDDDFDVAEDLNLERDVANPDPIDEGLEPTPAVFRQPSKLAVRLGATWSSAAPQPPATSTK